MKPELITQTDDYFVLNKPPQMATEPPSNEQTLQEWLAEQGYITMGDWSKESRFGIVHRLDADTSGVMIWAKSPQSQDRLRTLWRGRAVKKTYIALVSGETPEQGMIEVAIMRDNKKDRQTVALLPSPKSRPAITEYRRLAVGEYHGKKVSLVEAHPITGRTHQIRVHLKSIGYPIIGDRLYGEKESRDMAHQLNLARQFLHASSIELDNTVYHAPLPVNLTATLEKVGIELQGWKK